MDIENFANSFLKTSPQKIGYLLKYNFSNDLKNFKERKKLVKMKKING